MISQSEQTFGARLARAQELLDAITNFTNYVPPQASQTVAGFTSLIQNAAAINTDAALCEKDYHDAVTARQNIFQKNPTSIMKILPSVKAAVLAQFGKDSVHYKEVTAIIKTMTKNRVARPLHIIQSQVAGGGLSQVDVPDYHVSQSERSFGSMAQHFQTLIDFLGKIPAYTPSNTDLQVETLQDYADSLRDFSKNVNEAEQALDIKRHERNGLYTQLGQTAMLIKQYVKAQYGPASPEFALVKDISV